MATDKNKTVVLLASDLMISSTVSGFAADAGVKFRGVSSLAALAEFGAAAEQTLLLIDVGLADLNLAAISEIVSASTLANAIAYGPHVHEEKLQAARDAGIGHVISRGAFSAGIGRKIHSFATAS